MGTDSRKALRGELLHGELERRTCRGGGDRPGDGDLLGRASIAASSLLAATNLLIDPSNVTSLCGLFSALSAPDKKRLGEWPHDADLVTNFNGNVPQGAAALCADPTTVTPPARCWTGGPYDLRGEGEAKEGEAETARAHGTPPDPCIQEVAGASTRQVAYATL
jgi:hypothetical protein